MNRQELVTKLELVGRALADSSLVPIFQCFCFDGKIVSCYNDQLGIIAPCLTDDAFAVNGQTLLGLLKASQSEEVEFKLGENHEIVVKAGKSNFKLPYHPKDAFLFKEPEIEEFDISIRTDGLRECLVTSSKDAATQPALVGVMLNGSLYSCDGDALTRFKKEATTDVQAQPYMMPNAFCETVLKIANNPEKDLILLEAGWAKAVLGEYVVYGRLIENDKPLDHEELIKKTLKQKPVFLSIPEELDHALSRARVVADPESKPTKLTVEGGKLHLLTDTYLGIVKDVLSFKGPEVTALVSAELVQRSIGLCKEMAIMENCLCFRDGEQLFVLLSNYG